jgi:ABC-type oligopeptide transport system ATPase subunit
MPATTRQTAGPGFNFEDLTSAWLISKMLLGQRLQGVGTEGAILQSQTSSMGWLIDDLLVSTKDRASHLAVSCKSNVQVSRNGFPKDFVDLAWKQWKTGGGSMQSNTDCLGLVTRGRHPAFDPVWADITNWAKSSDEELALSRIRATSKHSSIFDSIKCPNGSAVATDHETLRLAQRLIVVPLDFQLDQSTSEADAISRCRLLIQSGAQQDAENVWKELVQIAEETRVGSGTISISEIWDRLRPKCDLKDHPNFESSWDSLRALSRDSQAGIQSELPSGLSLPRLEANDALGELVTAHRVTVVVGESGTGKSALVKSTLDKKFPTASQIWLGPEHVKALTSEVGRRKMRVVHDLASVLMAARSQSNVLVLDAIEKLDLDALSRAKKLIDELLNQAEREPRAFWRIVVVCQTEAWRERVQMELKQYSKTTLPLATIQPAEVKEALRSSAELRWLSFREEAVSALTNLKTLSWVMRAAGVFDEGDDHLTTPTAFVDGIWKFWTEGQVGPQNLLIRLAEREANFERSFAISELDATDAQIFQQKTQYLPLRKNHRNRIEFEHDLAAEWVRFQRLKEISHDIESWSPLADNPLWTGSLRLLGQFLLRQRTQGSNEWIEAFSQLERQGATLAADILLDSVFLDPEATKFLFENKDFLFEENGKYLQRLLQRFLQVATVPDVPLGMAGIDHDLELYMEAQHRFPILAYWPPIAYFLHQNIGPVSGLVSPIVAQTCATWCSKVPRQLADGSAMPWRSEFAEIALATARSLQVDQGKGTIYLGDGERPIYKAAFASVSDLPDQVVSWALEVSQRRTKDPDVALRIERAKSELARERADKIESDPEYRMREADRRSRRASLPSFIDSSEPLPPWPLGPQDRIENDFQHVVLHDDVLVQMMAEVPEIASEILLANLVEANPRQEFSRSAYRENVGLSFDHTSPTIFWKSPFWRFFQVQPAYALSALIKLVNFATERWSFVTTLDGDRAPPGIFLNMKDGSAKKFVGNWDLYDWSHSNSTSNGQLHCALNALEKWLVDQLEGDADIEKQIEEIFETSNSLALIGVLVNVGKHTPKLFSGPLLPLVGCERVFLLDEGRLKNSSFFDAFTWSRAGEVAFNMAREWAAEAYRQRNLVEVVVSQMARDERFASSVQAATVKWVAPKDQKASLEHRMLKAQLDRSNYTFTTETDEINFALPSELLADVDSFQKNGGLQLAKLMLADNCRRALAQQANLPDAEASYLWEILCAPEVSATPDDEGRQQLNKASAAAVLTVLGSAWLRRDPDREVFVKDYLQQQVETIEDPAYFEIDRFYDNDQRLEFLAHSVFHLWCERPDELTEWEAALLKVLASGDNKAAGVIGALAYRDRRKLDQSWFRIVQIGVLWSALSMLKPDQNDPDAMKARWKLWRDWLCKQKVSGVDSQISSIDFPGVWSQQKKLEKERWRRTYEAKEKHWTRSPEERLSFGLDTQFLSSFLHWLTQTDNEYDAETSATVCEILLSAFQYQTAYCKEHMDERGEYGLPPQFGYDVVQRLAFECARTSDDCATSIYKAVLSLGPAADHIIGHFLGSWFIQLHKLQDTDAFCGRWQSMIQFGVESRWAEGGSWYDEQKLLRKLLGLEYSSSLQNIPDLDAKLVGMSKLYESWATNNLRKDEENVSWFAYFLKSDAGRALRIDGLKWLAASLTNGEKEQYWRDSSDTGSSLVDLIDKAFRDQKTTFQTDTQARHAILKLSALLVAKQIPSAMSLQQKISTLR